MQAVLFLIAVLLWIPSIIISEDEFEGANVHENSTLDENLQNSNEQDFSFNTMSIGNAIREIPVAESTLDALTEEVNRDSNFERSLGEEKEPEDKLDNKNDSSCGPPPTIQRASWIGSKNRTFELGASVNYTCEFGYMVHGSKRAAHCVRSKTSRKAEWTQPLLTCIPRSCGDPGFVLNARRVGSLFTFPNNVTYECNEGFKYRGTAARYCQASGTWSGRLPSCEKILCPTPESPDNGRVFYPSLEYGSELQYECDVGFKLRISQPRICQENAAWSGDSPSCSESLCDQPTSPEHGSVQVLGGSMRVGSIAIYSCEAGRTLEGAKRSRCLENGEWLFEPPKCIESCMVPEISNGEFGTYVGKGSRRRFIKSYPGSRYNATEDLILRCYGGFYVFGTQLVETSVPCDVGNSSKNLKCERTSCSEDPPPTSNAYVERVNNNQGGTVTYYCNRSFRKAKYGNITCNFGSWEGFRPICKDTRCYSSKLNYPGLKPSKRDMYYDGNTYYPYCEQGFKETKLGVIKCKDGEWNVTVPPCDPDNDPAHQFTSSSAKKPLSSVEPLKSNEGLKLTSNSQPHTLNSNLSISNDTACFCEYLSTNRKLLAFVGKRQLKPGSKVSKGSTVKYLCEDIGYYKLRGTRESSCGFCGQLLLYPVCTEPIPGDTVITFEGNYNLISDGSDGVLKVDRAENLRMSCYEFGSSTYPTWKVKPARVLRLMYYSYYDYAGRIHLVSFFDIDRSNGVYTCTGSTWRQNTTIKVRRTDPVKKCPKLVEDENYTIQYENDRVVNSTAVFRCKRSSQIILEANVLTCDSTGNWSGKYPECVDITCPEISPSDGMSISYAYHRRIHSLAYFFCNSSRKLAGNSSLTCLSNGSWSGQEPTCVPSNCSVDALFLELPEGVFPVLKDVDASAFPYGTKLTLNCEDGMRLAAPSEVECVKDGEWSIPKVDCVPGCAPIWRSAESSLIVDPDQDFFRFGDSVTLSCPAGSALNSMVEVILCLGRGWSESTLPSCT